MIRQCEGCIHNDGNCDLGLFPHEQLDCPYFEGVDDFDIEKKEQRK